MPPAAKKPASKPAAGSAAAKAPAKPTSKPTTSAKTAAAPTKKAAPAKAGKAVAASPPSASKATPAPAPAPPPEPPPPPPLEPVVGQVHVRYNHYNEEFDIVDGRLDFEEVDEKYCISFVFKGNWKAKLKGPSDALILPDGGGLKKVTVESDDVNEDGDEKIVGSFSGLTIGGDYVIEVDEDPELENAPKTTFTASAGMAGRNIDAADGSIGISMGEDRSSCSCLFGNPCASPYNCKDWHNRLDVAKRNGWKGFS